MTWDQFLFELQLAIPSVETALSFVAVIVLYFVVQRLAKVRQTVFTVTRDLAIVGATWLAASFLLRLDAQNHWLQHTAAFLSNVFSW
jgi:hypothetical protein